MIHFHDAEREMRVAADAYAFLLAIKAVTVRPVAMLNSLLLLERCRLFCLSAAGQFEFLQASAFTRR